MHTDIAGDSMPGNPADARADLLNRRHQWIAEQHDPRHAVSELSANLGVGGDATGIVVGGASDQSRAEEG